MSPKRTTRKKLARSRLINLLRPSTLRSSSSRYRSYLRVALPSLEVLTTVHETTATVAASATVHPCVYLPVVCSLRSRFIDREHYLATDSALVNMDGCRFSRSRTIVQRTSNALREFALRYLEAVQRNRRVVRESMTLMRGVRYGGFA